MKMNVIGFSAILLFSITLFYPHIAEAVIVSGLYETEVPVSDQSVSSMKKNMAAALSAVLIKLTGDRWISSRHGVVELLSDADQYVQQFEYRTKETKKDARQFTLWARFNSTSLDNVLRDAAIPVWGRERPSTLIWLAVDDTIGRRLIGLGDVSGYAERMDLRAKNRGIQLTHPLLDLDDTHQLRVSDVWGDFREPVLAASRRYHTDVVLAGRLEAIAPESWQAHWSVYIGGQTISWVTRRNSAGAALDEGVAGLADALAKRFGQVGRHTQTGEIEILVHEITDYQQYSRVLNYLESLNAVSDVQVSAVNHSSVAYVLTVQADATVIARSVGLGQTLELISTNNYRLLQ